MPRPSNKPIQLLKGFKDILPEHQDYWEFFMSKAKVLMDAHGFKKIDVPILEQTNLYIKGTAEKSAATPSLPILSPKKFTALKTKAGIMLACGRNLPRA